MWSESAFPLFVIAVLMCTSLHVAALAQTDHEKETLQYVVVPKMDAVKDQQQALAWMDHAMSVLGANIIGQYQLDDERPAIIVKVALRDVAKLYDVPNVDWIEPRMTNEHTPHNNHAKSQLNEDAPALRHIVVLNTVGGEPDDIRRQREDRVIAILRRENRLIIGKKFRMKNLNAVVVFGAMENMERMRAVLAPDVKYIEPDVRDELADTSLTCSEQLTGSTLWGLSRIAMRPYASHHGKTYPYNTWDNGTGVTAYVIDTGIKLEHEDFGGRATWGYTVPMTNESDYDGNGHGTHVAGTIGGTSYGVAKGVHLVAIKVFPASGSGYASWTIEGIEWATNDYKQKGYTKAVINMSLGSRSRSLAREEAVREAIDAGIVNVVAAGNSAMDACDYNPARMPEVITVASASREDWFSTFSNYGPCVDIMAPGEDILSASNKDTTSGTTKRGTSMATPHVAGAAARFISASCTPPSPEDIRRYLVEQATVNAIHMAPYDTPDRLLYSACPEPDRTCWPTAGGARALPGLAIYLCAVLVLMQ